MWFNVGVFLSVFMLGVAAGSGLKGTQVDDLNNQLEAVRIAGHEAQAEADAKLQEYAHNKEQSDDDYQNKITQLNANIERLRVARSRSNFVPSAPSGSRSPSAACFDRAELERALQRLDARVSELIAEGDAATIGLNVAREWSTHNLTPTH